MLEERCTVCKSLLETLNNGYYLCTCCHRMFRGENREEVERECIFDPQWN